MGSDYTGFVCSLLPWRRTGLDRRCRENGRRYLIETYCKDASFLILDALERKLVAKVEFHFKKGISNSLAYQICMLVSKLIQKDVCHISMNAQKWGQVFKEPITSSLRLSDKWHVNILMIKVERWSTVPTEPNQMYNIRFTFRLCSHFLLYYNINRVHLLPLQGSQPKETIRSPLYRPMPIYPCLNREYHSKWHNIVRWNGTAYATRSQWLTSAAQ